MMLAKNVFAAGYIFAEEVESLRQVLHKEMTAGDAIAIYDGVLIIIKYLTTKYFFISFKQMEQ